MSPPELDGWLAKEEKKKKERKVLEEQGVDICMFMSFLMNFIVCSNFQ